MLGFDLIITSFAHLMSRWRVTTTLVSIFLVTSIVAQCVGSIGSSWYQASQSQVRSAGFHRITITASASASAMTSNTMRELKQRFPQTRIVPQLAAMIYVEAADGHLAPLLASSFVENDPMLVGVPILRGNLDVHGSTDNAWPLVVSPATLQRLGYDRINPTSTIAIEIHYNDRGQEHHERIACYLAAVIGDLGKEGLRLPLDKMIQVRRFQRGHQTAETDVASPALDELPFAFANRAATWEQQFDAGHQLPPYDDFTTPFTTELEVQPDLPAADLEALDEIDTIHLVANESEQVPHIAQKLSTTKQFRVTSPYFERGRELARLKALVKIAIPFVVGLTLAVTWSLFQLMREIVEQQRGQMALMQLAGGTRATLVLFYWIPHWVVAVSATVGGTLISTIALQSSFANEVNEALEVPVFGQMSPIVIVVAIAMLSGVAMLWPLVRAAARLDLDERLMGGV